MTVSSGIEAQDYDGRAARDRCASCEAVQNGDFEAVGAGGRAELYALLAPLARGQRGPRWRNYYLGQAATGLWEDTDALIAQLEAVTPERVAEAARSIRLDTVYFLTGKEGAAQ